jgi:gliding motility-associated-like protein
MITLMRLLNNYQTNGGKASLIFLLLFLHVSVAASQTIWYVKATSTGLNNGASWADAFTQLQPALDAASASTDFTRQIWVAAGTYKPTQKAGDGLQDRDKTFILLQNIKVCGGFAGNEPGNYDIALRNINANETTLSGDIGIAGDNTDNCYHVVISNGPMGKAEINGFTIKGGNANDSSIITIKGEQFGRYRSGGIYNKGTDNSLVISNCTIKENSGNANAAILNYSSSPDILNCTIINNIATERGANRGGAGGINNYDNSTPTIVNCLIAGNKGDDGGGIMNVLGSGATIINCTITGNTALGGTSENNDNGYGGGVSLFDYSTTRIYNSIIWGNTAMVGSNLSNYQGTSTFYIGNSIIEGGYTPGFSVIDANPEFINPVSASAAPTSLGNYRLKCSSPAIDKGYDGHYPAKPLYDLAGNNRITSLAIDMGAYEYQGSQKIVIQSVAPGLPFRYCPGNSISVSFTINNCAGNFNPGNIFTLQLSDSSGSFSAPVAIGSLTGILPGTIFGSIPSNTLPGKGYRIRIISSDQSFISSAFNVALTVLSDEKPSILISADNTQVCAGDKVSFNATVLNGGASPLYQWKKNGNNVGTNSSTYADNNVTDTDEVTCELTNTETCAVPSAGLSNKLSIKTTIIKPAITISADNVNICSNQTVTFNAVISGGGTNPVLQWKKNGINVGGNNPVYSTSGNGLTSTDIITCILNSNASCASPAAVSSNELLIKVNAVVVPEIKIKPDRESICPGDPVTFTAIVENGGSTPFYQWKKNGINAVTNSFSYVDATLTNTDVITCEFESNETCISAKKVKSNEVKISVGLVTPGIIIKADKDEICNGETVQFSSAITNGGTVPFYQWQKNGINTGLNSPGLSVTNLTTTDVFSCNLTSSYGCVTKATVSSNKVSVLNNPLPAITISKSNDITCTLGEARLIATGGIKYEWQQAIGINDLFINNPIVNPGKTTVYNVKVITDKNCSDSKAITVNVSSFGKYELPNSFTPNNDGINDCFGISHLLNINNLQFSIYNRYGQQIFFTSNFRQCWDGKYRSIDQPPGTYTYIIKAKGECGTIDRKGTILLIR